MRTREIESISSKKEKKNKKNKKNKKKEKVGVEEQQTVAVVVDDCVLYLCVGIFYFLCFVSQN